MSAFFPTTLLVAALVSGLALGVRFAAWPLARVELPDRAPRPGLTIASSAGVARDSLGKVFIGRDAFRPERRPTSVAYDPLRVGQPPAATAPRPVLALVGIVAGRDPTAVIEGFPGVEGSRVVRTGDVVAGLRVERISAERVRIVGMDTTWVLGVREPWR